MPTWVLVLIGVFVLGLAAIVYGALSDRARNRRRAVEMTSPPERVIPHLPADARPPAYVSQAQARRRPTALATGPTSAPVAELEGETTDIRVGYASADFVTNPATREALLNDPLVLVAADGIGTVRELVPVLQHSLETARPLVIVAPAIAPDVLGTLEVNAIQGKMACVAIIADEADRTMIIETSGATLSTSGDRRSGWVDPAGFGHAARWVSTATSSRLTTPATMTAP